MKPSEGMGGVIRYSLTVSFVLVCAGLLVGWAGGEPMSGRVLFQSLVTLLVIAGLASAAIWFMFFKRVG